MIHLTVAGFQYETNSFSPHWTGYDSFAMADSWPALTEGPALWDVVAGRSIPLAGLAHHGTFHEISGLGHVSLNRHRPDVVAQKLQQILAQLDALSQNSFAPGCAQGLPQTPNKPSFSTRLWKAPRHGL